VATPSLRSTRRAAPARREIRQARTFEVDRPRLASGAILLALAMLGLWVGFGDAFYVVAPKVTGNVRVPEAEIVRGSGLLGLNVMWFSARETETTLLRTVPSLQAVRVSCGVPARCTIAVVERAPTFVWRWGGASAWIDERGVAFPARGDLSDLPVVESIDVQPPLPGQRVDEQLLTAIRAAALALPDVRIFRYSAAHGLEFSDASGYPVYLGSGPNMSDRAAVWRALREDLAARGVAPKYVDVRFPLAPYYER
jgi:hypothetical protein